MLAGALSIELLGQEWLLLPQRAVWWPAEQALILSDLHVGKSAHFRKAGLPLPALAWAADLARLDALVQALAPRRVVITGDLFHSSHNREMDDFGAWRARYPEAVFTLARGNHDILKEKIYAAYGLDVMPEWRVGNLAFRHDLPKKTSPASGEAEEELQPYFITGHLHPGLELLVTGRQRLKLPCFLFAKDFAVLPAFSRLTGLMAVRPAPGDRAYGIAGEERVLRFF